MQLFIYITNIRNLYVCLKTGIRFPVCIVTSSRDTLCTFKLNKYIFYNFSDTYTYYICKYKRELVYIMASSTKKYCD